jgi:hypothetical protein
MAGTRQPVHPPREAYSDEEFGYIVDRVREVLPETLPQGTVPVEQAAAMIRGPKGRGPHCGDCGMKPAGMEIIGTEIFGWRRMRRYRCVRCGTTLVSDMRKGYIHIDPDSDSDTDIDAGDTASSP